MINRIFTVFSFLFVLGSAPAFAVDYHNEELGVSFSHPDFVALDTASISKDPLKMPFTMGEPPMSVYVLLKETRTVGSLEDFLAAEHAEQEERGYKNEMKETKFTLQSGQDAVEFVRETPYGTLYYFAFPIEKSDKIMALWLMSAPSIDPENKIVDAYKQMRDSLTVSP